MEERLEGAQGEILARVSHGVATVTLNRPAALNALTLGMLEALAGWLDRWEHDERVRTIALHGAGGKAFCAGGDVRALRETIRSGDLLHHHFFEVEYALDYRIHTYPKPIAAFMDGIVMGGGMGISQGAGLRFVGDRTRMAMPETAIGLFPDVGGTYFLSRMPGELGTYLGLVGATIGAADAVYGGLADVNIGTDGPSELAALHPVIDEHFAHGSVEEIDASLAREGREAWSTWAGKTRQLLARRSPTLLKVTLEALRRGRDLPLADCFRMELNLMHGCFEQGDLLEGIRAVLVDKDNQPRWRAAGLRDVAAHEVAAFFSPRWTPERHPLAML
jgi:enoyl-CoA hydratase/carnithine racemase